MVVRPTSASDDGTRTLGEDVALLRAELLETRRRIDTMQREIRVVQKGIRTGIFDTETDTPPEKTAQKPEYPQFSGDQNQHTEPVVGPLTLPDSGVAPDKSMRGPERLLAEAEVQVRRGQCGRAIVLLSELQSQAPEYADAGRSDLILAECWRSLGQHERALTSLRQFFLNHPDSPDLLRAKVAQAMAYEGLHEFDRSLTIYKEVIALGPETPHARDARAAMQRLRDMR